ncbi:MAG: nicotinate-nucleotide adenylyltransferase [Chloroflexia bacterium]
MHKSKIQNRGALWTTKIGIMGGSFDPIHVAHLVMADTVREALGLDLVLFLPAGSQPLKQGQPVTPAQERVEMIRRAIEGNPGFGLSRVDVDREGLSYTADSLEELRLEWVGLGKVRMWFIIGSDSLLSFPRWHEPARILAQTRLAVVRRPAFAVDMAALEAQVPGIGEAIDWVDAPLLEISATEIRRRVREGRSIRYRVTEPVRDYIEEKGLYRDEGSPE